MAPSRSALEREAAVTSMSVPHTTRSVHDVRRRLREDLQALGIAPGTVEDAEIVVAELLGNAIRHARPLPDGTVGVSWRVTDGVLDVTVTDGGSPHLPTRREPPPLATGGRGLQIIAALSRAWGVVDRGRARTVWAALVPENGWAQPVAGD